MQKDFHYYTIRILAEKAGFCPADAQTIAYASQYVDDATEHKPIQLPLNILLDHPRLKGDTIDPTCTAHKGVQFLEDFKKQTQMQIYMAFHFLPEKIYKGEKNYSYITKPNSEFAKKLLEKVKKQYIKNTAERTYNLISLGIALHTYADTWSHQNFSGTHSHRDNNIDKIRFYEDNNWKTLSKAGKLRKKILPVIGHAEAYNFPDLPFLTWKYEKIKNKKLIIRNNLNIFIDAAEHIYNYLKIFNSNPQPWENFSGKLIKCLSFYENSLNRRCQFFRFNFPEIGFFYNKNHWKNMVLYPDIFAHTLTNEIQNKALDIRWLLFHKAAFEQRRFVLKNLKTL